MEDPNNEQQQQQQKQQTQHNNCQTNAGNPDTPFEMNADEEDDEEQSFDLKRQQTTQQTATTAETTARTASPTTSATTIEDLGKDTVDVAELTTTATTTNDEHLVAENAKHKNNNNYNNIKPTHTNVRNSIGELSEDELLNDDSNDSYTNCLAKLSSDEENELLRSDDENENEQCGDEPRTQHDTPKVSDPHRESKISLSPQTPQLARKQLHAEHGGANISISSFERLPIEAKIDVNGNGNGSDVELAAKQAVEDFVSPAKQHLNGNAACGDGDGHAEQTPKINGDHRNCRNETEDDDDDDDGNEVVADATSCVRDTTHNDIAQNNVEEEVEKVEAVIVKFVENAVGADEPQKPLRRDVDARIVDWHDDSSCSSLADSQSSERSAASASSSSSTQQLVIDDVLADGAGSCGDRVKKSRSDSADDATRPPPPRQSSPLAAVEESGDIVERVARDENKLNKIVEQTERMEVEATSFVAPPKSVSSPSSSLLMQLLEQNRTSSLRTTTPTVCNDWMLPPPPPPSTAIDVAPEVPKKSSSGHSKELAMQQTFGVPHSNNQTSAYSAGQRVFKCHSCIKYFDEINIYLHMLTVHGYAMCTKCSLLFCSIEKLAQHLEFDHDEEQQHHATEESFRSTLPRNEKLEPLESRYLMCCTCKKVMAENEPFTSHECMEMRKMCQQCGQIGRHTHQCRKKMKAAKRLNKLNRRHGRAAAAAPAGPYRAIQRAAKSLIPQPQQQQQQQQRSTAYNPMMPPSALSTALGGIFAQLPNKLETSSTVGVENATSHPVVEPHATRTPMHEDSNSSCNMVIDESCNAQHHATPTINPFKMLDERERQEQLQEQIKVAVAQPAMPPDRLADVSNWLAPPPPPTIAELMPEPAKPERVMLKLRVPKQYQKPVDDEISSMDSCSGVETEEDGEDEDVDVEMSENAEMPQQVAAIGQQFTSLAPTESEICSEESQDDASKNLERVLQEIEQTKLDIQRTKDHNRHMPIQSELQREPILGEVPQQQQQQQQPPHVETEQKEESPPAFLSEPSRTDEEKEETHLGDEEQVSAATHTVLDTAERTLADDEKEAVQILDELKYSLPLDEPLPKVDTPVEVTATSDAVAEPATPMAVEEPATPMAVEEPATPMAVNEPATPMAVKELATPMAVAEPVTPMAAEEPATSMAVEVTELATPMAVAEPATPMAVEEPAPPMAVEVTELATPMAVAEPATPMAAVVPATSMAVEELATPMAVEKPATPLTVAVEAPAATVQEPSATSAAVSLEAPAPPLALDKPATTAPTTEDKLAPLVALAVAPSATPMDSESADIDVVRPPSPPADGIELASEDTTVLIELQLEKPLDAMQPVEFARLCVAAVWSMCLFCRHARRIAVNGRQLVLHLLANHRFAATVDSITAEELRPDTIQAKLKSYLPLLQDEHFNCSNYCTADGGALKTPFNERVHFECFECCYDSATHKDLYLHNRKMHLHQPIMCFMCRTKFFNFCDLLCHICPGVPRLDDDLLYRCCLCDVTDLPSPFRLMVHLRKKHHTCDVCLEDCLDQGRLAQHVWKHKQQHRCFRCRIGYSNKEDITRHLFWKHGTESTDCKHCLLKRWPHVYHFCTPKAEYTCETCQMSFPRAAYLLVHRRVHQGEMPHSCPECDEKFISRGLRAKHTRLCHAKEPAQPELPVEGPARMPDGSADTDELEVKVSEPEQEEPKAVDSSAPALEDKASDSKEAEPAEAPKTDEGTAKESEADSKVDYQHRVCKSQPASRRCSVNDAKAARPMAAKKRRKPKEYLEDLNLIAPNLSETDSSDSDDDRVERSFATSRGALERPKSEGDEPIVPRVMLSPPSEVDSDKSDGEDPAAKGAASPTSQALSIWQNYFKSQGDTEVEERLSRAIETADYTEDNYPEPQLLHVTKSDHDYCSMQAPPPPPPKVRPAAVPVRELSPPVAAMPPASPLDHRPRRTSHASTSSSGDSSSSSSDSSDSSSDDSSSSASSNSSDGSDSSARTNRSSPRKLIRKKSERDLKRKKSVSVSPSKKAKRVAVGAVQPDDQHAADNVDPVKTAVDVDAVEANAAEIAEPVPPFHPSDFETEESDTDEEFYDAKPSLFTADVGRVLDRIASTPQSNNLSLPSTVDSGVHMNGVHTGDGELPKEAPASLNTNCVSTPLKEMPSLLALTQLPLVQLPDLLPPPPPPQSPSEQSPQVALYKQLGKTYSGVNIAASRMSEGSSCSDADGPLKRSKRIRRPNRLYCDDEYEGPSTPLPQQQHPPVRMGNSTYNPSTPPEFTWDKDDLPAPQNRIKNARKRKQEAGTTPNAGSDFEPSLAKKRKTKNATKSQTPNRWVAHKKASAMLKPQLLMGRTLDERQLPPIPTLKIRSSQMANASGGTTIAHHATSQIVTNRHNIPNMQQLETSDDDDDDDDDEEDDDDDDDDEEEDAHVVRRRKKAKSQSELSDSSDEERVTSEVLMASSTENMMMPQVPILTAANHNSWLALAGIRHTSTHMSSASVAGDLATQQQRFDSNSDPSAVPQATAFNNKVPPALLPNPSLATLNYFRANNIRYPIRPPEGARRARNDEPVYCYCRCPYDEVSEMIACDGQNCVIEWFHFECVGIMVAPQGKWFCAECRPRFHSNRE